MRTLATLSLVLAILLTFSSCNTNKYLNEEQAIKAAEKVIKIVNDERRSKGIINDIINVEWKGLFQTNETTAELKAIGRFEAMQNSEAHGIFLFIKSTEGEWILDKCGFDCGGYSWGKENIFYKIPK